MAHLKVCPFKANTLHSNAGRRFAPLPCYSPQRPLSLLTNARLVRL